MSVGESPAALMALAAPEAPAAPAAPRRLRRTRHAGHMAPAATAAPFLMTGCTPTAAVATTRNGKKAENKRSEEILCAAWAAQEAWNMKTRERGT